MKTHIQALACLAALLAAVHAAAEDGPRRRGGGPINRRAFATEAVDKSLTKLDELVKRKTEKREKHEELWDQEWEGCMGDWRHHMGQNELELKGKNDTLLAEMQAWRATNETFFSQLSADGHRILYWRGKLRTDRYFLNRDVGDYEDKMENRVANMDEVEKVLDAAAAAIGDKNVSVADLDKHLAALDPMVRMAGYVGASLQNTVNSIEKRRGLKAPTLAKDVAAILARWEAPKETYPDIMTRWTDTLSAWAKIQRKEWADFDKTRKLFDKTYGPVIAGKIFDDRKHFKGLKYTDYKKPVEAMRTSVRAWKLKATRRETDISELRKALEEEKRISVDERKRYDAISAPYSPMKDRELRLALAQAAGGALAARELRLKAARAVRGSAEYNAFEKEADDIKNGRHPDQIAAEAVYNKYRKVQEEARVKLNDLMAKRKRRRAKLGLSEDFD